MKLIVSLFVTVFFVSTLGAQEITANEVIKIELLDSTHLKTITKKEIKLPIVNPNEDVIKDVTSEYWDHTVYNPYKDIEISYPFKITFKDSFYASPIGRSKVITSRYGWRRGRAHKGIDIDLVTGDSVFAVLDGVVRFARYNTGHGRTVIVRHYNGLETVYAHLSKYGVKENDTVVKGQYLGKGGVSGNARGSHLHFVMNYKGISIHPEYLFNFDETNSIRSQEIWVTKKWTRAHFHSSRRKSKLEVLATKDEAIESLKKQRKIYVVQKGDTLSRIAKRNNVPISSICKTNFIKRNSTLRIGQKLVIEI